MDAESGVNDVVKACLKLMYVTRRRTLIRLCQHPGARKQILHGDAVGTHGVKLRRLRIRRQWGDIRDAQHNRITQPIKLLVIDSPRVVGGRLERIPVRTFHCACQAPLAFG